MLLSPDLQDVVPLVLELLVSDVKDLINVDCTCSHLRNVNKDVGWRIFATKTMALPLSYKVEAAKAKNADVSWREFLTNNVKPIYTRLSKICTLEGLKKHAQECVDSPYFKDYNPVAYEKYVSLLKESKFPPLSETCARVLNERDWPLDVGIFIACHCYLTQAPLKDYSFFNFGYDTADDCDSIESYAFWDSFSLGGGDTNWWSFVVLKGTVKVPLAPVGYSRNNKRGEPVEIGRGGIVAFSHWNHGGSNTTAKHVYPGWDPVEFGIDKCEFENPCDEWVRVNIEEPVAASRDSLPAAWRNIFEFMDELERSLGKH